MKHLYYILLLAGFFTITAFTAPVDQDSAPANKSTASPSDTFPVPTGIANMAFYVQRTHNTNTIVYELNYINDTTLNTESPIHAYWLRYADGGGVAELSSIQRNYAYGVDAQLLDAKKGVYKINFVSYKKRDIYLMRTKSDHRYHAYMALNGKLSRLHKDFVKIEGGTFWVPRIRYVELTGTEIESGKKTVETFIP